MDYNILKKSLRIVASFASDGHAIETVEEFKEIHARNLKMLNDHVIKYNDTFISELLKSVPSFDSKEIQGFMDSNRGAKSFLDYVGIVFGPMFLIISSIFKRIDKKSGRLKKETFQKMETLSNKNLTIISVLENSGY